VEELLARFELGLRKSEKFLDLKEISAGLILHFECGFLGSRSAILRNPIRELTVMTLTGAVSVKGCKL
jgi:hypothetical protein